jgi:hypothetical protein
VQRGRNSFAFTNFDTFPGYAGGNFFSPSFPRKRESIFDLALLQHVGQSKELDSGFRRNDELRETRLVG